MLLHKLDLVSTGNFLGSILIHVVVFIILSASSVIDELCDVQYMCAVTNRGTVLNFGGCGSSIITGQH